MLGVPQLNYYVSPAMPLLMGRDGRRCPAAGPGKVRNKAVHVKSPHHHRKHVEAGHLRREPAGFQLQAPDARARPRVVTAQCGATIDRPQPSEADAPGARRNPVGQSHRLEQSRTPAIGQVRLRPGGTLAATGPAADSGIRPGHIRLAAHRARRPSNWATVDA